jgi:biopolymer transport protein ExbD
MRLPKTAIKKARIEIIPMIDTIFFLLVFFMISSLSMVKMKGMGVALPTESSSRMGSFGSKGTAPSTLVVTVTDSGEYYVNKKKIVPSELQAALQYGINANNSAVVVMNIAKSQTTQQLINAMDAANRVVSPTGKPVPVMIATEKIDLGTVPK